jgi:hypothetical protein
VEDGLDEELLQGRQAVGGGDGTEEALGDDADLVGLGRLEVDLGVRRQGDRHAPDGSSAPIPICAAAGDAVLHSSP